jgi:predicted DNA-binding mobile mystery protein A
MPPTTPLARRQLDRRFAELRPLTSALRTPRGGWIRLLRTALGMRQEDLGARLRVSAQAVGALERREAADGVTLAALRQAADALDAELYYVLLPRQPLETQLEQKIDRAARFLAGQVHHSMRMEDQATEPAEFEERVNEIKEQLRLAPSLLWTLPREV